ncbi:cell division protein FtsL [Caminicella sporogenes DSM 14501]|uniref:Cell division protein FtsL n=1 Tax=Caminicella sporogenes DSM 14501 TaxID=1121266 RepID=A0A1M6QSR7_9FIRM|nr:septum formation initiator family protein [Caminicella sporogenes]RKD20925.1 hypothetical protein BET04_08835 [Caminicella sporogenes]SHK23256.1 cell division protein FtsL [Caminicella sporogenes DSM 14501]
MKKMKKKSFLKRNRIHIIICLILFIYLSITMIKQEIKIRELKNEEKQALKQVNELKMKIKDMKKNIEKSDSKEFVEKVAREKLKMVKPNEIIYIIQDNKKNN